MKKGMPPLGALVSWRSLSSKNESYQTGGFVDAPGSAHPLLVSMIRPREVVLEVGCSTGYISEKLKSEKQCTIVGIEVDESAAAVARNRVGIPVFVSSGELPDLPNEYVGGFDVILCSDVVEHTRNPLQFIECLRRYASPTGRFIFSIPNIAHWTCRLNLLRGKWDYTAWGLLDYTHLRFFTLDTALQLLEEAGLRVRSVSYCCGPTEIYGCLSKKGLRPFKAILFRIMRDLSNSFPRLFALQFIIEANRLHSECYPSVSDTG
jgi:methionine biosynthesis protein MetW